MAAVFAYLACALLLAMAIGAHLDGLTRNQAVRLCEARQGVASIAVGGPFASLDFHTQALVVCRDGSVRRA